MLTLKKNYNNILHCLVYRLMQAIGRENFVKQIQN